MLDSHADVKQTHLFFMNTKIAWMSRALLTKGVPVRHHLHCSNRCQPS